MPTETRRTVLELLGAAAVGVGGVDYADRRDLAICSDMVTGLYVFKFTPSASGGGEEAANRPHRSDQS